MRKDRQSPAIILVSNDSKVNHPSVVQSLADGIELSVTIERFLVLCNTLRG